MILLTAAGRVCLLAAAKIFGSSTAGFVDKVVVGVGFLPHSGTLFAGASGVGLFPRGHNWDRCFLWLVGKSLDSCPRGLLSFRVSDRYEFFDVVFV